MKFSCNVDIELPIEKVIDLFDNIENLKEWQDGFVSYEHISGSAREQGAKSKIIYKAGKHKIELIETILVNNLPEEFTGKYEAKQMTNTMKNSFTSIAHNKTKYDAYLEYTSFNGVMPKLMALLTPWIFRKQTQKWLNQFKTFAEKNRQNII